MQETSNRKSVTIQAQSEDPLTRYRDVLRSVIAKIDRVAYDWPNGKSGVTENITWQGKRIFTAADPPRSHCVGAVGEAFLKTLKELGFEKKLSVKEIERLRAWIFVYDVESYEGKGYFQGGPGGLLDLNIGRLVENPSDSKFGDLCQIWHVDKESGLAKFGHAVIVTGLTSKNGKPALEDWSSSASNPSGHKFDWHYFNFQRRHKDHPGKSFERKLIIGRPDFSRLLG